VIICREEEIETGADEAPKLSAEQTEAILKPSPSSGEAES
jgi:hypothetical protein